LIRIARISNNGRWVVYRSSGRCIGFPSMGCIKQIAVGPNN